MSSHVDIGATPRIRPTAVQVPLAGLARSVSTGNGAGDRAQTWRGKYLRALNICPKDIETAPTKPHAAKVRSLSCHHKDLDMSSLYSRSYSSSTDKDEDERSGRLFPSPNRSSRVLRRGSGPRTPSTSAMLPLPSAPAQNAANPYGFVTRPMLSRGRRCHTDPFVFDERVSAPIQIPSCGPMNNQLDGNHRSSNSGGERLDRSKAPSPLHRTSQNGNKTSQLLSWEEPVAMLAAADAVRRGWQVPVSTEGLGRSRENNAATEEEDMEMTFGDVDEDEDDDHDGVMFEMEEEELEQQPEDEQESPVAPSKCSRRRYRTESLNILSGNHDGREKRTMRSADRADATATGLPASFIPPHQMIERDCFSIGLRDEFKRRPVNNI